MMSSRAPAGEATERASASREVRAATGADQDWLAVAALNAHSVAVACSLIERCSDGARRSAELLDVPVGDRVTLLWEIRRATFGDVLDAIVGCSQCGEKLDVRLAVSDLVGDDRRDVSVASDLTVDGRTVAWRLPTGRDQLAVADAADPARALCRRIVVAVDDRSVVDGDLDDADVDALIDPVGEAVAAADPAADTTIAAVCPACGAAVSAALDAYGYLRDELLIGAGGLLREIHVLASRYHWSEAEILALPLERRRAYLELIADEAGR